MQENQDSSIDTDFDSQNIFDEFSDSGELQKEVQKIEEKTQKDMYFYIRKLGSFFLACNVLAFLVLSISLAYIYIQNAPEKKSYNFLTPICGAFLGDARIGEGTCYGISAVSSQYKNDLEKEKLSQTDKILPLLGEIYSFENFNLSKKVSFLLQKTDDRLRPLDILAVFDEIKGKFAPIDKTEVSCYDITLERGGIFSVTCDTFSSDWDRKIITLEEGNISYTEGGGTSISRASSFMHFIENYPNTPFRIIERPKTLNSSIIQSGPYTQKTTIQLRIQYDDTSKLSI